MNNGTKSDGRKPGPKDKPFLEFLSHVLTHGALPSTDATNMAHWQEEYKGLVECYQEGGLNGFNLYLNVLKNKHKQLVTWLAAPADPDAALKSNIIILSDVTPEAYRWLWPGRLALGKLHMLDGDPGLGKTMLVFDLIARLTSGRPMPYEDAIEETGGAVLICLEDGIADTIQPRLARAGADLDRVASIGEVKDVSVTGAHFTRPFSIELDMLLLEEAIKRVGAKLVLIDPIMAILGGKDTYKDNEVRATLAPLKELAERCGVAIIMIRHINKSGYEKLIYQGGGSIGFIGLARIGLMVLKNPDDENQCIFATIKSNLAKRSQTPKLLYSVVDDEDKGDLRPYIRWDGESHHTDQELAQKPTQVPGQGRQEILRVLKESHPKEMTPQEIADELGVAVASLTVTLGRMVTAAQIKKAARGMYVAHSGLS